MSTRHQGRELTEVRGLDELDEGEHDWPSKPARKGGQYVTQAQLIARPLTGHLGRSADTPRCWCGRPLRSTGRCAADHARPDGG